MAKILHLRQVEGTDMDRLVERLATITDYLVSFPTVDKNPTDIDACLDWVRAHVLTRAPRLRLRQFTSFNKTSLLFTAGDEPPRVLFSGHLDVVEAPHPDAFKTASSPDGVQLRGRGTADMKGPIAAMLDVIEQDTQTGMGLLLTTDEELGGDHGTAHFLNSVNWRPEVVILPDGGANMRLITAQKGVMRLYITAQGKAAHGSRPWLGKNAIEALMSGYRSLLRYYPHPQNEEDWRVSITLSEINGGVTPNSVPWHARGTLDIRYPASETLSANDLYLDIKRRLQRFNISTDVAKISPAFSLDMGSPAIDHIQKAVKRVRRKPLDISREAGASDAHYFAAEGVPVLMFQPFCGEWHGDGEWIDLQSLGEFRQICAQFAKGYLGRERSSSSSASHGVICEDITSLPPSISAKEASSPPTMH